MIDLPRIETFLAAAKVAAHDHSPARIISLREIYNELEQVIVSHFRNEERELEEAIGLHGVVL